MVEQIAKRIISRIKAEVSAFLDESEDDTNPTNAQDGTSSLVSDVRDHLGKLLAEHHQASKELATSQQELSELQAKIELAIDAGREDLARAALIRRKGLERQIASHKVRLADIQVESEEVEQLIVDLSTRDDNTAPETTDDNTALSAQLDELEKLARKVRAKRGDTES